MKQGNLLAHVHQSKKSQLGSEKNFRFDLECFEKTDQENYNKSNVGKGTTGSSKVFS